MGSTVSQHNIKQNIHKVIMFNELNAIKNKMDTNINQNSIHHSSKENSSSVSIDI